MRSKRQGFSKKPIANGLKQAYGLLKALKLTLSLGPIRRNPVAVEMNSHIVQAISHIRQAFRLMDQI